MICAYPYMLCYDAPMVPAGYLTKIQKYKKLCSISQEAYSQRLFVVAPTRVEKHLPSIPSLWIEFFFSNALKAFPCLPAQD